MVPLRCEVTEERNPPASKLQAVVTGLGVVVTPFGAGGRALLRQAVQGMAGRAGSGGILSDARAVVVGVEAVGDPALRPIARRRGGPASRCGRRATDYIAFRSAASSVG